MGDLLLVVFILVGILGMLQIQFIGRVIVERLQEIRWRLALLNAKEHEDKGEDT